MHAQLQAIDNELRDALERLRALRQSVTEPEDWGRRPEPERWSIAECIAHLNLTSQAYAPIVRQGLAEARELGLQAPNRYHRDLLGWFLWKTMGPPVRFRVKTTAAFVPTATDHPDKLIADFVRFQVEQSGYVRAADGLRIDQVKVTSPFNARLKYNLYACLTILPRHQHRHLWQAEQVWRSIGSSRSRQS